MMRPVRAHPSRSLARTHNRDRSKVSVPKTVHNVRLKETAVGINLIVKIGATAKSAVKAVFGVGVTARPRRTNSPNSCDGPFAVRDRKPRMMAVRLPHL